MLLDLHFDPTVPASWRTARWLESVRAARDVTVRLRPHSPLLADDLDTAAAAELEPLHRALRVGERAREEHGDDATSRYYLELLRRLHGHGHHLLEDDLDALLDDVGLEPALVAAALDPTWDDEIELAMEEAGEVAGDVAPPVVVLTASDGVRRTVVDRAGDVPEADPDAAVARFDELVAAAGGAGAGAPVVGPGAT